MYITIYIYSPGPAYNLGGYHLTLNLSKFACLPLGRLPWAPPLDTEATNGSRWKSLGFPKVQDGFNVKTC